MSPVNVILPDPVVEAKYTYDLPGELLYARGYPGPYIINSVVVTIGPAENGELWIDVDGYGYKATRLGKRDKRSSSGRVYVSEDWAAPFIDDAKARYQGARP